MMWECRRFGYKEVSLEIDVMKFMKEDHLMWKLFHCIFFHEDTFIEIRQIGQMS